MQTVEFQEAMRKARAALIAAAEHEQSPAKSALLADRATMCSVWLEIAERLTDAIRREFAGLVAKWLLNAANDNESDGPCQGQRPTAKP